MPSLFIVDGKEACPVRRRFASLRRASRLTRRAVQRWLAAELVRWQSLHEDLHATTQVLAELALKLHVATQVPALLAG